MSRFFVHNSYYFLTVPTVHHYQLFDTPKKKQFILGRLVSAPRLFHINDLHFGILSNHYHCVAFFPKGDSIPRFLQHVNGESAFLLNRLAGNRKSVWGEYHVLLIEEETLLEKVRGYVVGNPLKHGEVKTFDALRRYPFSSYRLLVRQHGKETAEELVRSVIEMDGDAFPG